ncbi:DUF6597 domain-containing transcriptional factor [Paenibacillus filicis]|uniref:DUF6597 domain-containing transcriptional factor n=1 Tax=Paenibacillus filicis TaxID=669464 RepID=UPI003BFA2896
MWMNIRFEYPCPLLQSFIECCWSWESDNSEYELHHLPRIIPSTNMEMILFYKEPFSISDRKGDGHRLVDRRGATQRYESTENNGGTG